MKVLVARQLSSVSVAEVLPNDFTVFKDYSCKRQLWLVKQVIKAYLIQLILVSSVLPH